jgi:hypothetical protein
VLSGEIGSKADPVRAILLEILLGAAVLAAATWLVAGRYGGPELARARREIEERRPVVVFLGNSTAREGIDEAAASEALGAPAMKLWGDGSGSALWWLLLKNVLADAKPRPRVVCVLFRDHELTDPELGLTGEPAMQLAATSTAHEPELERIGYRAAMGPLRHLAYRSWPLWQARDSAPTLLDRAIRQRVVGPPLGFEGDPADVAYWNVLGDRRMDRVRLTAYQLRADAARAGAGLDFDAEVGRSFLPPMVEQAREAGIALALVRIRTRRDALGVPMAQAHRRFGERARAWCRERGVPFLDHRGDGSLTADHFGFGDHLTDAGARLFTRRLCEELEPLLGNGTAPAAGTDHH